MENRQLNKDIRDSDGFRIYLKASNITNTQSIVNSAVSISDKYGIEVSSKISKGSHSIDVLVILEEGAAIISLLENVLSIIYLIHGQIGINNGEIRERYDSIPKIGKRLVRSILQTVKNLRGKGKLVEITFRGFHIEFEADQLPSIDTYLPMNKINN